MTRGCHQNHTAADWRLRVLTVASARTRVRLSRRPLAAIIETGKLEHGTETVEELVGQPLVKWRRAELDSSAAGMLESSLVSDYGDKQPTTNRSGSRFGGVACTV